MLLGKFRLRWVLETRKKELKVLQVDHFISVQPQGRAFVSMVDEKFGIFKVHSLLWRMMAVEVSKAFTSILHCESTNDPMHARPS